MTRENELTPFTFSNGRTVMVRRVSPMLAFQLRKDFPPPRPPMQEVDFGNGEKSMEANPAHPAYQQALDTYEAEFQDKTQRLLIKLGVSVELTDSDKAEVQELRDFWLEEFGKDIDQNDKMIYVNMVCVTSDKDLQDLLGKIMVRSMPTEEAIAQAQESFPSSV